MANIEIVLTCPLGSTCEEIRDNKLYRCRWYKPLAGVDPNTGKTLDDEWGCAIEWMPLLLVENSMQQRSTSAAVESFRNETMKAREQEQQKEYLRLHPFITPTIEFK